MPQSLEQLKTALADRYELHGEIGAGGMATVYSATDRKHNRNVAVKVLRPELAAILGGERFLKEIEVTANLQHPNILPLYDSGSAEGFLYYVMPFVDGESLRDRMRRETQLRLEDAVDIGKAVANALDYAHRNGVIHRDIKPENILLHDGQAVVADFGIALAVNAAGGERLTETGLSLGTPEYMSPEQATGDRVIDHRCDIYSLGALMYEMLTGDPPFQGNTTQAIIAKMITTPPVSPKAIRDTIPAPMADAILKALAKSPADRFDTASAMVAAFTAVEKKSRRFAGPVLLGAAGVLVLVAAGVFAATQFSRDVVPVIGRTIQITRDPGLEIDPSLSPDGSMIAYAAGHPTQPQIFVRQVSGGSTIALTNDTTRFYRWPRWSPDGSRIAYQTAEGIDVVPALGGQPQILVRLPEDSGLSGTTAFTRISGFTWSPEGERIAYTQSIEGSQLVLAPINGAPPTKLAGVAGIHAPAWSPDGTMIAVADDNTMFVFGTVYFGNEGSSSIWIFPVNGAPPTRVTDDVYLNTSPQWAPDGRHLYWVSSAGGGRDVYRVAVAKDGRPVGDAVRVTTGVAAHTISLSADGMRLAYSSFRTLSNIWSMPIPTSGVVAFGSGTSDRTGHAITTGAQTIEDVDVSADGARLVFDSDRNGNSEIYTVASEGGEPVQLTHDPAGDYAPAWSPDGQHIAFHSLRNGTRDIFTMRADGSEVERHTGEPGHELDVDWSPDGRMLSFELMMWDMNQNRIGVLPVSGGDVQQTTGYGDFAIWSPNQDLIAYHANDGLRVYSFQTNQSTLIVPTNDTYGEPFYSVWSPNGETIYYVAYGTNGTSIHAIPAVGGTSRLLVRFDDPARQHTRYGFTTDGRRFYFTLGSHESDVWVAELQ